MRPNAPFSKLSILRLSYNSLSLSENTPTVKSKGKKPSIKLESETLEVALLKTNLGKRKLETLENNLVKARKLNEDPSKRNINIDLNLQYFEKEEDDTHDKEKKEGSSGERRLASLLAKDRKIKISPNKASPRLAKEFTLDEDDESSNEDTKDEYF